MNSIRMNICPISKCFFVFLIIFGFIVGMPSMTAAQEAREEQEVKEEEEDPWADVEFPFEDEKLLAFFDSNQDISALQRETNEKIAEKLGEYNLTMERFQQIGRAAQMGALQGGAFTTEETEAFNEVAPQVTNIQRDMQGMIQMVVEEHELGMAMYREILTEFRQNQLLQQYVSHLARERAIELIREERRKEAERKAEEEKRNEAGGGQ